MTKKPKMCPHYNKPRILDRCYLRGRKPKSGMVNVLPCPNNTTNNCEIIPAKPKVVKVKAWACLSYGDVCALSVKSGPYTMPCTILIDEKYLKEKRK